MRPQLLTAVAGLAILLAGCGKPEPAAQGTSSKVQAEVKKPRSDGIPDPQCPARAPEGEGPDIKGLRLGMPALKALDLLRCANPDAGLSSSERWAQDMPTYGTKLTAQQMTLRIGRSRPCDFRHARDLGACQDDRVWEYESERYLLVTPGLPGRQRLAAIWRLQRFEAGDAPTAAATVEALSRKYGQPQLQQGRGRDLYLAWARDAQGQPLAADGYRRSGCPALTADIDGSVSWQRGCGLWVAAQLTPRRDNPALVEKVSVALLDQDGLERQLDDLRAELSAAERQRRSGEVDKASGKKVDL